MTIWTPLLNSSTVTEAEAALFDIMAKTPSLTTRKFVVVEDGRIRDSQGYCPLCAALEENGVDTVTAYPWSAFARVFGFNHARDLPKHIDHAIGNLADFADNAVYVDNADKIDENRQRMISFTGARNEV